MRRKGERERPTVCRFKTSPCVGSKRLRVQTDSLMILGSLPLAQSGMLGILIAMCVGGSAGEAPMALPERRRPCCVEPLVRLKLGFACLYRKAGGSPTLRPSLVWQFLDLPMVTVQKSSTRWPCP